MKILKWAAVCMLVLGTIAANDVAPTNAELEGMYDKAFRAFDAANYVQALKELDAIDARKPDLAASQNLRGVIYMRQGLYDKAEAALSEAERLDPKFWNARFNLAEIPFLKKDWAEARKRFQELLTGNAAELKGEATQLIQYKILLTYLLEGNDTMVDSILAKFELSPDTPAVHYANAAIALQRQNIPEAKNWMTAAEKNFSAQLNKLFAESLFEIGWLEKQAGQQRAALQLLTPEERAAKAKTVLRSQFEQAQQAYEQRDFENAGKLAEQADSAEPNQPSILNLRGEIFLEQQKFDEAEALFKKALKVDPKFREAQFNLADVPFRKKEYAKARDRFESLFKQTPGGDKNQAAQLIKFKIFMTYLLEGKDSRAQKMMEQFQFSGDTPALYYAQAAWEFQHDGTDKANDWIASARKIYPLSANAAYGSGFYDLGWLKSAAATSSPSPAAAVDAAAIASAQNESSGPAVEPSPIPGVETKIAEEGSTQFSVAQAPAPLVQGASPAMPLSVATTRNMAGAEGLTATAQGPASLEKAPPSASIELPPPAAAPSGTPDVALQASAAQINVPAIGGVYSSPVATSSPPNSVATPAPSIPVNALPETEQKKTTSSGREVTSSPTPAPAIASTAAERLDRMTDPRTLLWIALLLGGIGALAWAILPSIRRRIGETGIGQQPATVTGPDLSETEEPREMGPRHVVRQFAGGPRQISVQLKASEPSLRRAVMPLAKRATDTPIVAEPERLPESANGHARVLERSTFDDFSDSCVGPVIEQAPEAAPSVHAVETVVPEPEPEFVAPGRPEETAYAEATSAQLVSSVMEEPAQAAEPIPEATFAAPEPVIFAFEQSAVSEPIVSEPVVFDDYNASTIPEEIATAEGVMQPSGAVEHEPILQGQPVPYQTVVWTDEPAQPEAARETDTRFDFAAEIGQEESPIVTDAAAEAAPLEHIFIPQPTTTENMPETLQTPTAPVIRTSAGGSPSQPAHTAGPASQASPSAGMHTAVQITLSCEIASMQLTPTFKMGALQLRPISKVVTMRLAPSQQPQPAMNLQVNFELAKVQPAPNSLGQVRLNPSQQQKPASLTSPSFNIAGLQIVSGFEGAPVQLTPSQQGQASVLLTAAFQITTVEFSQSFDISAIILSSSSKTVSVQLPGAGASAIENAPIFEITNVQLTSGGEIAMLQLNPVGVRRG
ncbi:MAG TPA: tetratricopeptide repeat protein [Chthoniobacterales bacterium]